MGETMKDEPIRSVSRAFEILEYFRAEQRPLALKDLVQRFGYPIASTADLLKSLFHLGYLTFDVRTKTYIPAPHLFELTAWMSGELIGQAPLVDAMKALQKESGRTVLLGSINDIELLLIVTVDGQKIRSGKAHRPLVKSGMGNILLSAEDEGVVERIYRRTISRGLLDRSSLSLNQLFRRLEQIREVGYVVSDDQIAPNHSLVSMLAPTFYYNRPLALGIHGRSGDILGNSGAIVTTLKKFVTQQFAPRGETWEMGPDLFRGSALEAIETRVH
jgi:DNA-binding IclR family transcriptional regulator